MFDTLSLVCTILAVAAAVYWIAAGVVRRLQLSRAKHRSLTGHSRMAKRVAAMLPAYDYDERRFFDSDGAPPDVADRRRQALQRMSSTFASRFERSIALTADAATSLADLRFTRAYRVPYQYRALLSGYLQTGVFVERTSGVKVADADGNWFYDLTGSYGVNVFGYDFYKHCIAEGSRRVAALGPVLGAYHPAVITNAQALRDLSGLDEVSFHMSGTEAVMQAVRLARYHTRRSHLVRFCGAYHGWWEDVQPGPGNPLPPRETYTLEDMSDAALRVLSTRNDIACVLVNPLQALHPNRNAPADSSLVDSSRSAQFDRARYTEWLRRLRQVCTDRGIVLILDEVFTGFRLARGGAQEYFGVQADMVIYGKTLGGGLPVGVVCGRADLMKRFRDDRPADVCFARGTFNSHPYVMGAMQVFLELLRGADVESLYRDLDACWHRRVVAINLALKEADVPVSIANLSSIWTVLYTRPSRYNWMFQFYLRDHALALSWVGSGRLIFSLNYSDAEFAVVMASFVAAARAMQRDGWWWAPALQTNTSIRRRLLREMIGERLAGRRREGVPATDFNHASSTGSPCVVDAPVQSTRRAAGEGVPCNTASRHETDR